MQPNTLTLWFRSIAVAIPIMAFAPPYALAQEAGRYPSHMWHGWSFGPMMMFLFIILIAIVVILAIQWSNTGGRERSSRGTSQRTPRDILDERFARGEIDKEEYEERRRVLDQ